MSDDVLVRLTPDEALVLFEWLHRMEGGQRLVAMTEDHAERVALWNLSALLERELIEPFSEDYTARLATAKARLVAE